MSNNDVTIKNTIWNNTQKGQKIIKFTGIDRYEFTEYYDRMMKIFDIETGNQILIHRDVLKDYFMEEPKETNTEIPKLKKENELKYSRIQIICPTHIFKSKRSVLKIMNEIFNSDYKKGKQLLHVISCGKHDNNIVSCYYKKNISISFMADDVDFIRKIHKFISTAFIHASKIYIKNDIYDQIDPGILLPINVIKLKERY